MARRLDAEGLPPPGRHPHVEVARLGRDPVDRSATPQNSPQITRALVPSSSVTSGMCRCRHVLVARRRHLERGREVRPELEPVHPPGPVALRHLLVEDAAPGGHPLHVAGPERAPVAQAVAVLDRAREHVRDGLDAAVRVPGKAGEVVLRPVVAEVVEQQERVELLGVAEPERPSQAHPGALDRRNRAGESLHRTDGHAALLGGSRAAGPTFTKPPGHGRLFPRPGLAILRLPRSGAERPAAGQWFPRATRSPTHRGIRQDSSGDDTMRKGRMYHVALAATAIGLALIGCRHSATRTGAATGGRTSRCRPDPRDQRRSVPHPGRPQPRRGPGLRRGDHGRGRALPDARATGRVQRPRRRDRHVARGRILARTGPVGGRRGATSS